ncbi:MAG: hypothetical protein HKP44_00505 [Desulfofustis sp.]|nr:hypothetical protein [Desulfofustis sp.]
MGWFRKTTPDECAEEIYNVVFRVQSYFKATLIEENEEMDEDQLVELLKDRNYEMLLVALWIMHTYLPSKKLRDKVCERFFKAVRSGSRDIGKFIPLEAFQEDLEDRLKIYSDAYDKLRFFPSVGVDEFGGMIAQVIHYGNHPSEPSTNVTPHEVNKWYFRARVAMNKWHNEIKKRKLVNTIQKYSDPDPSHLPHHSFTETTSD